MLRAPSRWVGAPVIATLDMAPAGEGTPLVPQGQKKRRARPRARTSPTAPGGSYFLAGATCGGATPLNMSTTYRHFPSSPFRSTSAYFTVAAAPPILKLAVPTV